MQQLNVIFKESTHNSVSVSFVHNVRVLTYNAHIKLTLWQVARKIQLQEKLFYPPFQDYFTFKNLLPSKLYEVHGELTNGRDKFAAKAHCYTKAQPQSLDEDYQDPQEEVNEMMRRSMNRRPYTEVIQERGRPQKYSNFLCKSQQLVQAIAESNPYITLKNVDRTLLQARNQPSLKDFMKADKKRNRVLVGLTLEMLDSVSKGDGMRFLGNDWFMGPFYSYNGNFKKKMDK